MPSPSQQRQSDRRRLNRDRCFQAAAALRHRATQSGYAGIRGQDESYAIASILDSAGVLLDQLPPRHASAVLAAVTLLLDDDPSKLGPVKPLTSGRGH